MTLTKIKGTYHARIHTASGRKTITTRTTDKAEARRVVKESGLEQLEAAGKAGRLTREVIGLITTGRKLSTLKALDAFEASMLRRGRSPKTIANSITTLHCFLRDKKLETLPPSAVTEKQVNDWINDPRSDCKAQTRVVNLSALRTFFEFCAEHGWVVGNVAGKTRASVNLRQLSHAQKEVREVQPFHLAEVNRLVNYCNKEGIIFWEFAVLLSWETGLRLGDIANLEFECFSKPGHIIVWTDKRNRRVAVPISNKLSDLVTMIPMASAEYLFPEQRALNLDPTKRAYLSIQFKRLCDRLEITGKTFHSLRHACISRWAKEGKSLESIGKDVGHSSTSTTKGYVH